MHKRRKSDTVACCNNYFFNNNFQTTHIKNLQQYIELKFMSNRNLNIYTYFFYLLFLNIRNKKKLCTAYIPINNYGSLDGLVSQL